MDILIKKSRASGKAIVPVRWNANIYKISNWIQEASMNKWNLYSVLKLTREGMETKPLKYEYKQRIKEELTIRDIENMDGEEVKEAVIEYLQGIVFIE